MKFDFHVGTIAQVLAIETQIPEFDGRSTATMLQAKLADKANLILIATYENKAIAYKIGYEVTTEEFYSWLGGVAVEYRKRGVATQLRKLQESWAINHGYSQISVKSMNRYPAMLHLLISSGYQISGYDDNGSINSSKIRFIKQLN